MKRVILLILLSILIATSACVIIEDADHYAIPDSTDYKKQVEMLKQLLENENSEGLFSLASFDNGELNRELDDVLTEYLIAIIETDDDELLRSNIVNIIRSFQDFSRAGEALVRVRVGHVEKLEIIIPEMILAYEEIEEGKFWERRMWVLNIWILYFQYDDEGAEMLDIKIDHLNEELLIVFDYEKKLNTGEISIDDVPVKYRPELERMLVR